ncbi:MAG TPA: hypothetical protein VFB14_08295 [Bryobacteraceae bacterium]|nr:hypothetical protein [Bryobacteraceae bacterium]
MSEEKFVFKASRWTAGNLWFPLRIEVTPQRVSRIKPRLIGSNEESISISQVASVTIRTGLIWSTIQIDSTGGTDPIVSHGHRKRDAIRIRDLIEQFQQPLR